MSPEYQRLASIVDEETIFLSGGFDREQCYQDLLVLGPRILPDLLEDIAGEGSWWQFQMVGSLAQTAFGQTIYFDPDIRGKVQPVRQRYLDWWEKDGRDAFNAWQQNQPAEL